MKQPKSLPQPLECVHDVMRLLQASRQMEHLNTSFSDDFSSSLLSMAMILSTLPSKDLELMQGLEKCLVAEMPLVLPFTSSPS